MKFSHLSAVAALAAAALLSACGGKATYAVQGEISGLNNAGMVLANGNDTISVPAGANHFSFPTQISYGSDYSVTIPTQPAHMTCGFLNSPTGSAGHTVSIDVQIGCNQNTNSLGGQYSGLKSADTTAALTLINGTTGGTIVLSQPADGSGAGDFTFPALVADGQAYGVTVLTQPNGLFCTVANAAGVMHEIAVSNLLVKCVPTGS